MFINVWNIAIINSIKIYGKIVHVSIQNGFSMLLKMKSFEISPKQN